MWLLACRGEPTETDPVDTGERVIPPVTADRMTVLGHAQECAQVLGPIPGFDCIADADPVPVTLAGEPASSEVFVCDRPSLLEGSCNRWTRAGRKGGTWLNGDPRPEVTFVFTCRSSDVAEPTEEGGIYHDVAMIGHNAETGATCFFQSFPTERIRYFPSPLTAGGPPDVGTADALDVWDRPALTADIHCNRCHGADPWIHSPWIDQMRSREDASQPLVPWTALGQPPYHVVGTAFSSWNLRHLAPEGNACLACHRIAPGELCEDGVRYASGEPIWLPLTDAGRAWPTSHWMPPEGAASQAEWESVWRPHVDQLLGCCRNPSNAECARQDVPPGEIYVDPRTDGDTGP